MTIFSFWRIDLFSLLAKKLFDDKQDQEDIDKQKSEIPDHVDKDMMDVVENKIMNGVRQRRCQDKNHCDTKRPVF